MIRSSKPLRAAFAAILAGVALITTTLVGSAAAQQTQTQSAQERRTFSHIGSDVTFDPSVTYGVLPNGLRYAIMKNSLPPGAVAMRMHISAGSAMEEPDQAGLAHFVEHMAFNGSTNVAEGEVFKMMERLGAQPGPDTNAYTSTRETVYMFNLPKNDEASVDTALLLFRETASELKLDPGAIDRERGVVMSEERGNDSPGYRSFVARQKALFGDHPMARPVIGRVEVLRTAPPARLKAFYDAYYRPERATIVIVGDIDPAAMEAKVKARFSDWRARGPAGKDPAVINAASIQPKTTVYTETGLTPQVALTWVAQAENPADTRAEGRRRVIEQMALNIMNRRFSDVTLSPNPPFVAGAAGNGDTRGVARMTSVSTAGATDLKGSIESLVRIQRQAVEFGFRQDELDRVITNTRAALTAAAASASTRRTPALVDGLMSAITTEIAFKTPAQNLEGFNNVARDVTLAELNAALRRRFTGSGPVLFAMDGKPPEGGEAAVAQLFAQARSAPVTAVAQAEVKAWPYTDFGPAGQVAERREVNVGDNFPATFVKFANGVRLTVKPTNYTADRVEVRVMFGQGMLELSKDKPSPANMWSAAFVPGGLGKLTQIERNRTFTGKSPTINVGIGAEGFLLTGGSRASEFDLQMQLLAAYLTDPAWNPPGYDQLRNANAMALQNIDTQPGAVFAFQSGLLLRSNDQRFAPPSPELMRSIDLPSVKATMAPLMVDADLEVVIVGDIKVEDAIAQTARTFGALPKRKPRTEIAGARKSRFPAATPQPVVLKHKGRPDQGIAAIVWPTTGYWKDPLATEDARVLAMVMNNRAMDELREKQGKSYGVGGGAGFDKVFPDYGSIMLQTEISQDAMPAFFEAVDKIAADLRAAPPTQDEMDRALRPAREGMTRSRLTNAYWASVLMGVQLEPRRLDDLLRQPNLYDKVTPASVQKAAQTWLIPAKAWKATVVPDATGAATAAAR